MFQPDVPERVVYKLRIMVFNCLHGRVPAYLVELCQPVTGVASWQHLWSAIRQLLTVWLVRRPGIPCRTACGIRILEATVSDNLWRRFCSQRTDAFSALEVSRRIDDALYKSTFYLLTYWKACRNLPVDDSVGWAALSVVLAEGLSGTKYSSLSDLTARQLPSSLNWISVQLTSLLKMSANNLENKLTKSYHYVLTSFLFRNRQLHQPGL